MVENTDKLKVKKDYNKIGTEDDPIIIAQRFLNIFRQLHIFTDERKQAFNKMILEQPAEVRGMFSSLPGGAVLQQYVDDLEAKNGIIRSIPDAAPQADYEEEAKAKILATALAEANNQQHTTTDNSAILAAQMAAEAATKAEAEAQARIASQAAQEAKAAAAKAQEQLQAQAKALAQFQELLKNKNLHHTDEDIEKVAPTAIFQPISSTVTADGDFAKEIASALKDAIAVTDDNRKKESETLTKAIIDSQNKLAEIMAQNNSANIEAQNRLAQMLVQNNTANNASSSNANNIQINTAATFPPVEEMISGIVKVQSELFKEMAKTQTTELSSIISLALKESQQLSTQSIITAIKEMQKENLKFLQMHPMVYNVRADAPKFDAATFEMPTPTETPDIEPKIETTPVLASEDDDLPLMSDISDSLDAHAEAEEPQAKKKKKKKKKKKNQDGLSLDGIASSLLDKVSSLTDKVTSLTSKKDENTSDDLSTTLTNDTSTQTEESDSDLDILTKQDTANDLDLSLFDSESDQTEPKVENLPNITEGNTDTEDGVEWEYEEVPAEEILQNFGGFVQDEPAETTDTSLHHEIPVDEKDNSAESEDRPTWQRVAVDSENTSKEERVQSNIISQESNLSEGLDEASTWEESTAEENTSQPISDDVSTEAFTPVEAENEVLSPQTEDLAPRDEVEEHSFESENFDLPAVEESTFDVDDLSTAPQISDTTADEQISVPEASAPAEDNAAEGQDWEWDYEEVPAEESAAPEQAAPAEDNATEGQDWEWDYEEAPAEESAAPEQAAPAEDASTEGQDWEWDYEEAPAEESAAPEQAAPAEDNATEGQDWEWDYEEVPTEESAAPEQAAPAEDNATEGQDWEWDYEEVPAEESAAPEQAAPAEDNATEGQDWEWDYEEVPEGEEETSPSVSEKLQDANNDKALKFADKFNDPYHPETTSDTEESSPLSSIYGGEVYFQDKVYQQQNDEAISAIDVPENITDNFPLSDTDEKDEPYKPKTTI